MDYYLNIFESTHVRTGLSYIEVEEDSFETEDDALDSLKRIVDIHQGLDYNIIDSAKVYLHTLKVSIKGEEIEKIDLRPIIESGIREYEDEKSSRCGDYQTQVRNQYYSTR